MLKGCWAYRHFVISSIGNEQRNRFARSKFGAFWLLLNPLAQVLIYALVLSNVLEAKLPKVETKYSYAIYLMAGLLAWNLFSEVITRCLNLFIEQGNLMKKINFPRITLPTIAVGSSVFNNILLLIAVLFIFTLLEHQFSFSMLWIIPLAFSVVMLAAGIGLLLGVLNVFIRDIGLIIPIILQLGFWFTPIVYPISIIPEEYRYLLDYNPMYRLTEGYQDILVYNAQPDFSTILPIIGLSICLLGLSLFMFRRASPEMIDVL